MLTRSVSIGTGGFAYTIDAAGLNVKTFNPGFDSFAFGFDPATGTYDARTTSLNTTEGFGPKWARDWNRAFALEGIGPR
ncbi:hypothetical protein [Nonomuraea sp. NPDC046570]|uniref:hypothetical protein n=1 Tax=Nonomuraea sp. NPDC046570 TaxID=3155255 RepID=UPI0034113203